MKALEVSSENLIVEVGNQRTQQTIHHEQVYGKRSRWSIGTCGRPERHFVEAKCCLLLPTLQRFQPGLELPEVFAHEQIIFQIAMLC